MAIGELRYSINNFIGSGTPIYSSSEDALYTLEHLYNVRPSLPFRFEGIGTTSGAIPEWICVDLNEAKTPTLCAIFNHNFVMNQSGDLLNMKACDDACPGQSGACDWDLPAHNMSLLDRMVDNFQNLYRIFNWGAHQYWYWEFIDSMNPDGFIQLGDLFLGTAQAFSHARLEPGRTDGPVFYEGTSTTYQGQIWSNFYSNAEGFSIKIRSQNDPAQVDELRLFLVAVKKAGGKFVFIPDDHFKFCYYVHMQNTEGFGAQLMKGMDCEDYEWTIELRTLTEGVMLKG